MIKIVDSFPSDSTREVYDEKGVVFSFSHSEWRAIQEIEPQFGFISRLNKTIEMKCGNCGSFTLPCRDFFNAMVPDLDSILDFDLPEFSMCEDLYCKIHDVMWTLLNILTEEKITTDEEWVALDNHQMPEKNILYTRAGEYVFCGGSFPPRSCL